MNQVANTADRKDVIRLRNLCEQYLEGNTTFKIGDTEDGIDYAKLHRAFSPQRVRHSDSRVGNSCGSPNLVHT